MEEPQQLWEYEMLIEKGVALPKKDLNGFADPYCVIQHIWRGSLSPSQGLSPDPLPFTVVTREENRKNTRVCFETLDPAWNETFSIQVPAGDVRDSVDFAGMNVYDYDKVGKHDFIGFFAVPLRPVSDNVTWQMSDLAHRLDRTFAVRFSTWSNSSRP